MGIYTDTLKDPTFPLHTRVFYKQHKADYWLLQSKEIQECNKYIPTLINNTDVLSSCCQSGKTNRCDIRVHTNMHSHTKQT